MTKFVIGFLAIALVATWGLFIFYRNRKLRSQQELMIPSPATCVEITGYTAYYLATVFESDRLKKVWAHGLGSRGIAEISVQGSDLVICRHGEVNFVIPGDDVSSVSLQSATIDRSVERDGLVAVDWKLGDAQLSTVLRIVNREARNNFLMDLESALGVRVG